MFSWMKSLPVQLCLCIGGAFLWGPHLDISVIQFFYTLSSLFIDLLMCILPLIIFVYIFCSVVGLDRRSPLIVLLVLGAVTLSNLTALFTSYAVGSWVLPFLSLPSGMDMGTGFLPSQGEPLQPLWSYKLPKCLGTDKALLLGFILGLFLSFLPHQSSFKEIFVRGSLRVRDKMTWVLQVLFIPFLPVYILGFCLKLSYEGSLGLLFKHYTQVFFLTLGVLFVYLCFLYGVAGKFQKSRILQLAQTMLPAGMVGFSTMSSAAALPVTLKSTEKNTGDKEYTQLVVPATSNIHMLGDDLTIILTAMTLLLMAGHPLPDLKAFSSFALAFCFAKLSCVGIPGASVLVVLPVLEQFLGFNSAMISMLTTIYILQDPLGTFSNVMGNGAFALLLKEAFSFFGFLKKKEGETLPKGFPS